MTTNMSDIIVFDRDRVRANRHRASSQFEDYNFLFKWATAQLADRLQDINRTFPLALNIGSRHTQAQHPKIGYFVTIDVVNRPVISCTAYIQASEEFLPFASNSFDLIFSTLNLHSVNDLPGALLQIRKALKPDGLFIASMLGGETLHELRQAFTEAELSLFGGISPRVAPFADKPQMGDLLQRAGFSLPVVDSEIITVTYDSIFKLMHDLRGMGEGNAIAAREKTLTSKKLFLEAARLYHEKFSEPDGRLKASFEIIFLIGWAPHSSQQQPLRPGTAKTRLAAVLGTEEVSAGEKVPHDEC